MTSPISHEHLRSTGLFKELLGALRGGRSQSLPSHELLDEHEKSLRHLFPEGSPSGQGSEEYNKLVDLRREELEWQIAHRRRLQVVGLLGFMVWLAIGISMAWEHFAG
jgi:hypothetical protein